MDELEKKDCNCGCDECDCESSEDDIITLTDDEGEDVDFYQVATLDYQDKWYIFLEPVVTPEGMDDGELFVFELSEDETGDDVFLPIADEKLLDALFVEFDKLAEEDEEEETETETKDGEDA